MVIEAVAVGVVVLALLAGGRAAAKGGASSPSGSASALRKRALEIIASVVPSQYPDARFALLGWAPKPGSKATCCGALPGFMGTRLGDPHGITRWGVAGARTEGEAHGAWITPGAGRLPAPGDIFLLVDGMGAAMHVGIVTARHGNQWTTADAGQGSIDAPATAYVERLYNPSTHEVRRLDGLDHDPRFVAGWIDLARWPFPASKGEAFAPGDDWRYDDAPPCDPNECAAP